MENIEFYITFDMKSLNKIMLLYLQAVRVESGIIWVIIRLRMWCLYKNLSKMSKLFNIFHDSSSEEECDFEDDNNTTWCAGGKQNEKQFVF